MLRILPTSLQIFLCYFAIGLPMAVLPGVVHLQLHFNTVLAGLAISAQYVAVKSHRAPRVHRPDYIFHTFYFHLFTSCQSPSIF